MKIQVPAISNIDEIQDKITVHYEVGSKQYASNCANFLNIDHTHSPGNKDKDVRAIGLNKFNIMSLAAKYLNKPAVSVTIHYSDDQDKDDDLFTEIKTKVAKFIGFNYSNSVLNNKTKHVALFHEFMSSLLNDEVLFFEDYDTAELFFQLFTDGLTEHNTYACICDENGAMVNENT